MPVTSQRFTSMTFSGDVSATAQANAASNAASPGVEEPVALLAGNNALAVPAGATGFILVPPTGNTSLITLKGVNGDTGVALHKTDPTSLGIDVSQTTMVLNAVAPVTVRVYWT